MSDTPKKDEPVVTKEGQKKGDEVLRRMLNTPPKPRGAKMPKASPKSGKSSRQS